MIPRSVKRLCTAAVFLIIGSVSVSYAQVVKGKVTDSSNQPVPGAAVYFKGTTTGVSTDNAGNYQLNNTKGNSTIVVSFIGMKEQEIEIKGRSVINVVLEDETTFLEEAVSIGYMTVKRKDLLGAVASASNKDVAEVPVLQFSEALTGKLAGVSIKTAEGDPDAPIDIKVRGSSSITQDSSPLYIVDGFPVNSISDIAPSEIKSIDVLKDAFSTAIYGSRGAYGVVLITTREGASGKVSVSYDGFGGAKWMANANAVEVMSPYQYAMYNYENAVISGASESLTGKAASSYEPHFGAFEDMEQYKDFKGNNWKNLLFGNTGSTMSHSVNVSGNTASGKTRWNASYANLTENAIMMNSSYLRHNLALKASSNPVKNLSFNFGTRWSKTSISGAGANSINDKGTNGGNGRMINALRYSPIPMDYFNDEDYDIYDEQFGSNPVRDVKDNDDHREREQWNINGSVTWTIIPNLKLKVDGGMDTYKSETNRYYGLASYFTRKKATILNKPCMEYTEGYDKSYRGSAVLSYNFNEVFKNNKHKLDFLAGAEIYDKEAATSTTMAEGFPKEFNAADARVFRGSAEMISSSKKTYAEKDVMLSFFGRANYVYDKRYSVSVAMRADGSSKFAPQNRWGYFPSAAVSWDIANEKFLRHAKAVNQLKLRYSFGTAGNNRIPSGLIYRMYSTTQDSRIEGATNLVQPNSINPDLKWETTISHNVGIDFSFLKTRISGTLEGYHNTTRDLLINFPTPGSGYNTQYRNLGIVLNKGVEATLRFIIVEKKNFGLNLSGNIALNKNKVVKLGVDEIKTQSGWESSGVGWDYKVVEGEPLGLIYGYVNEGFYQIEDFTWSINENGCLSWKLKDDVQSAPSGTLYTRPGTPKFRDVDGDGKVDDNDKVPIGNALPLGTGGFAINLNAYGVDLSANFNFTFGNNVYNANHGELSVRGTYNYKNLLSKYAPGSAWTNIDWETGEQITDVETLREVNRNATEWTPCTSQYFVCDKYIEDGSFLRLGSLTIGYTFPQALIGRAHIRKLRIFCTGTNLFCLTKYSGFDPEVNCRRSTPLTPGVDFSAYPKSIGVVGGLNISF